MVRVGSGDGADRQAETERNRPKRAAEADTNGGGGWRKGVVGGRAGGKAQN
jgi:hypothetical protein